MVKKYIPDRGDVVFTNFSPQSGHEQAGKRPALVLSPRIYNERIGLALMCPITTSVKGYVFEVAVSNMKKVKGAVLADHVKSIDWTTRKIRFIGKGSKEMLTHTIAKLQTLLS